MQVVAVLGSPHKEGPSSTLAREVLRGAQDWMMKTHTVQCFSSILRW